MMGCLENRRGFFSRWCKGKVLYILPEESPKCTNNTLRASSQLEETIYDMYAFGPFISQQRTEEPILCALDLAMFYGYNMLANGSASIRPVQLTGRRPD